MHSVPFIDIKRFEKGFLENWVDKVSTMSKTATFMGGEEIELLKENLSIELQKKYVIPCANGTDAIQLALRALGIKEGDYVLLPDFTFWATYEAVINVGAFPITVDISEKDFQMDYKSFENALNVVKPKAAIIVHLYGWGSENLGKFRDLCKKNQIHLIEDGAQSFGSLYKNESIYKGSEISTISFYPAKVFGAAGDGGAVITDDEELAKMVHTFANHGRSSHYEYTHVGWNSRLDSLQAAFLNLSYKFIHQRIESRLKISEKYYTELPKKNINVIKPPKDIKENGYCNVLILEKKEKDELILKLEKNKIAYGVIYPSPISAQVGFVENKLQKEIPLKNSHNIPKSVLNLPLFPYITDEEFDYIMKSI